MEMLIEFAGAGAIGVIAGLNTKRLTLPGAIACAVVGAGLFDLLIQWVFS
jgi:hypothetical protein